MIIKQITSADNETVKHIVQLHTPAHARAHGQFIGEGIRTCTTLIESGAKLVGLYITQALFERARRLVRDRQLITQVSERVMDKIAHTASASGMLGVFSVPSMSIPAAIEPALVLARISDPGNMGTLIRSSVAFGFKQIIIIEGAYPFAAKVVQASAGTLSSLKVISTSWPELVSHQTRPPLCALVPREGVPLEQLNREVLLVVGNEAWGIPEDWLLECPYCATITMSGAAESLNAAVAGSIAAYELKHGPRAHPAT